MKTKFTLCLSLTIAMFMLSAPVFSQSTGRILGSVTDQSGGTIADAAVVVANVQTGVVRNLTTDEAGEYAAPNLLPGTYTVRAEAKGFKAFERTDILLEIDKSVRIDLVLQPGATTETVTVTGEAPMVETSGTTLGGTLSNDTINDLPLNGRNYQYLLALRPGVQQTPGGGSWTQSSNGLRGEDQNWVIDGMDNNESLQGLPVLNSPGTAGDAATFLPIDAIQEFNVEENPKAEWGWRPGAVVNVGLKAGTNTIHGTAYAFGREDSFDAKNFFNTPALTGNPNPGNEPLDFQQWGATGGGKIIKDKLFWFAGYEEQKYTVGNSYTVTIPTNSASATSTKVSVPLAEAALGTNSVPVSQLSLNLLPLFGSPSVPSTGQEFTSFPNTNRSINVLGKVDYNINSHQTISSAYFFGDDQAIEQDSSAIVQPYWLTTAHIRTQLLSGHWTWTPNSRLVNEVRVGFVRYYRPVTIADGNVPATHYGINTGVTNPISLGMPTISVSGLGQLGGVNQNPSILGPDNNYDFTDQLSYLKGKHTLKFGGEFRYARMAAPSAPSGRGKINFNGKVAFSASSALEDFLAGDPKTANFGVGTFGRNYRESSYAAFAQDDWRVKPRIILSVGLRWEYTAPIGEANNLIGNFVPGSQTGMEQVGAGLSTAYTRSKTNFAPRAGVAWDISGNGTTVLRVGGGLFYDMLPVKAFTNDSTGSVANAHTPGIGKMPIGALLVLPPTASTPSGSPGPTAPGSGDGIHGMALANYTFSASTIDPLWQAPTAATLATTVLPTSSTVVCGSAGNPVGYNTPCSIYGVDPHFKTPYVGMWTVDIQHSFSPSLSLEVGYVGNHGGSLSGLLDANQINPQSAAEIACSHCEATANRPFGTEYPYLQFINVLSNPFRSNYDGLQASFRGRDYHGVSFVAGYTYSHSLSDADLSLLPVLPQDSRNVPAQYGDSSFDVRHRFTLSTTYNIPGMKAPGQLLEGWTVNSIVTLQTAAPWTVIDTADDFSKTGEFEDTWDFKGNPNDFKSTLNPTPFFTASSTGGIPTACTNYATQIDGGTPGPTVANLNKTGCYMQGNSVMIPPAIGAFGTMGRDIFRGPNFLNWDLSVFKGFKLKERLTAQFRVEFFNVLNHPNFANPAGDPSVPGVNGFGQETTTPDANATNPVLGSGGPRAMQLGLKLIF